MINSIARVKVAETLDFRKRAAVHMRRIAIAMRHSPSFLNLPLKARELIESVVVANSLTSPIIEQTVNALVATDPIGALIDSIGWQIDVSSQIDDETIAGALQVLFAAYTSAPGRSAPEAPSA